MFQTLRQRLMLSHVLPVLLIIPIIGIALIYVLETNIILPELADEITGQARLIGRLAGSDPALWTDPAQARLFVDRVSPEPSPRVEMLDAEGRLLASNDPADVVRLGQLVEHPALETALSGQQHVRTQYSRQLGSEIADVLHPVQDSSGRVVGVVRVSHRLASVQELFLGLRYWIIGVLISGLGLGVLVGLLLALNMERPLRRLTLAVFNLTRGNFEKPLIEQGPTEIRLLSRAINTLVDRLRGLEQARRQLLANLVHELGRPLGAVHSAVWALLGRPGHDESTRHELLTGIEAEVMHLERLLDDLAQLHDQVLGMLELNRRPLELKEWLPTTLISWNQMANEKGLHWQLTLPSELPVLEADPDRLAQALGNLVNNAIKYTPEQGQIGIEAGHKDTMIWIKVSDTGPGISTEEQAQIFNPLYRGQSSGRFPQGMGLGLNIARELVAAHGGHISVDSQLQQGSHFTIWLPLEPVKTAIDKSQ